MSIIKSEFPEYKVDLMKIIAYWFAIIGPTTSISKKSFILALTMISAISTKEFKGS